MTPRTLLREKLSVRGAVPGIGEIVVASRVLHPYRGKVSCPVAPVIARRLQEEGLRVRVAPLTAADPETEEGEPGDVLVLASYVDRVGRASGLGVAVCRGDARTLKIAEAAVSAWLSVIRPRRIVLVAAGRPCPGERREAALIREAAGYQEGRPVHLVGRNGSDRRNPAAAGREVVASLDELLPRGGSAVLPAFGTPPRTQRALARMGVPSVDATCPLVLRAHHRVEEFAGQGDQVVVVGRQHHAATAGLLEQAPRHTLLVESVEQAETVEVTRADRLAYVVEPGMAVEEAERVVEALRARFPQLQGQSPDEFCYVASDFLSTVRDAALSCGLLIVAGPVEHPAVRELVTAARDWGCRVRQAERSADLRREWLRDAPSVAVVAAAPDAQQVVDEVVGVLAGLGPVSVVRRSMATERVTGPMQHRPDPPFR